MALLNPGRWSPCSELGGGAGSRKTRRGPRKGALATGRAEGAAVSKNALAFFQLRSRTQVRRLDGPRSVFSVRSVCALCSLCARRVVGLAVSRRGAGLGGHKKSLPCGKLLGSVSFASVSVSVSVSVSGFGFGFGGGAGAVSGGTVATWAAAFYGRIPGAGALRGRVISSMTWRLRFTFGGQGVACGGCNSLRLKPGPYPPKQGQSL